MALGWYMDVLVGYVIRLVILTIRARGSRRWRLEKATVTASNYDGYAYGGPVAEVIYTYTHEGELFAGIHQEPFILNSSAEEYAARFPRGGDVIVRVKSGEPEVSIVCDRDQAVGILG
ncbi:MAG TPA: hypothetical protein VEK84_15510 [Terriglobales bacterium]|nr:hypothetical protein [Terriglobales bacterium]